MEEADPAQHPWVSSLLPATNAKFVRTTLYWVQMQPLNNVTFNLNYRAEVDRAIANVIASGMTPYVTLEGTPAFARHCWVAVDANGTVIQAQQPNSNKFGEWADMEHTAPCPTGRNAPPAGDVWLAWHDFVDSMVTRYSNVTYWGIWNEPQASAFLTGDPAQGRTAFQAYQQLVDWAGVVIHDPKFGGRPKLLAPELGSGDSDNEPGNVRSPEQWMADFLGAEGYRVDIVTAHKYGDAQTVNTAAHNYSYSMRYGPASWQLWFTEVGPGPADIHTTAQMVSAVYDSLAYQRAHGTSRWRKAFWFPMASPPWAGGLDVLGNLALVQNYYTSPTTWQLYDCYAEKAAGSSPTDCH